TVHVSGPNARDLVLTNTNELLGTAGVHGVKTGTTDEAGACLVLAAWRGDDRVVTVVLGSADRYADTGALLDYLDARFRWVRLGRGADLPGLAGALQRDRLVMATGRTVLLTADEARSLRYEIHLAPARPSGAWSAAGDVVFFAGGERLLDVPLFPRDVTPFGG
ncbi:MAG: hypothetical protein IRY97_07195, partial [Thermomicrobiaceae bacterium]|nr:hypothetical protein [Thermomicrobiaceae bacterium]